MSDRLQLIATEEIVPRTWKNITTAILGLFKPNDSQTSYEGVTYRDPKTGTIYHSRDEIPPYISPQEDIDNRVIGFFEDVNAVR